MNIDLKQTSKKLLLVEDSPGDTALAKRKIKESFPAVLIFSAASIKEAYDLSKQHSFDVILLDLNLPDGFGPNSVSEIRRFHKGARIMVLTGFANEITKSEATKLGASDVLMKKDLMRDTFVKTLQKYL